MYSLNKKSHISFSELKIWSECTWRHKLAYIDGLDSYVPNPYASFGNCVHEAIENYLKTKELNVEECLNQITLQWEKEGYDTEEWIQKTKEEKLAVGVKFKHEPLQIWHKYANNILIEFVDWLDKTFPDWEFHQAEEALYEPIDKTNINFKGYIDAVISVPKSKNSDKRVIWVIDWKTTGPMGWWRDKRRDFVSHSQIGLYKKYWAKKYDIPISDIRTGFVFLKRKSKPGKCIELFKVSCGPKFIEKADKMVLKMIHNVDKQVYIKNRFSCQYCPFKNTEHCK